MKGTYLATLLQLRLLVGFLGERAQYAWWPTSFYDQSSHLFLEPVFSKTFRLAQYHGVVEAARRLHDEHLNVGSYHLFRLPEELEQDLHGMVQESGGEALASQATESKATALDSLRSLAGKISVGSAGPTSIGNIKDLNSTDVMKSMAGAYLSAFSQNAKTYPYLTS
jgi:hypothetical protein